MSPLSADEIDVDLGNGMIFKMPRHKLEGPFYSYVDNDHEKTTVTAYKYEGKIVHRSVHVTLKQGLGIEAILGRIGA